SDPTTCDILAVATGTRWGDDWRRRSNRHNPRPPTWLRDFPVRSLVACPRPRPIEPQMSHDTTVAHRQVQIINSLGLHLRPADKFVKLALHYRSEIQVHYNGNRFNGKSILDLITLAAECGTRLELEACGPDAVEA